MRALRIPALLLSVLFLDVIVFAGPMGPVKPSYGRFSLEMEIAADRRNMQVSNLPTDKRRAENVGFYGRGSYGLSDNLEVTMRLGGADFDYVDKADISSAQSTFNGNSKFAWGFGLGAILYEAGTWNLGGIVNYLEHDDHQGAWPGVSNQNNEMNFREWNVGAQFQGKFDQFLPYIGGKFSDARVETVRINNTGGQPNDDSDQNIGVYIGSGFDLSPQWSGYLEGRLLDETSFGGGVRYTF